MLIIGLNGPPRCGKDTVARMLSRVCRGVKEYKMATGLKRAVHISFGLLVADNIFETVKDQPREEFFGITPRQAYINYSEKCMKPLYGKDIFGKIMLRELQTQTNRNTGNLRIAVISDIGFKEEIDVLMTTFPVILMQIHRPGTDFTNDSREYIKTENTFYLLNDGDLNDLETAVRRFAQKHNLTP